MSRGQFGKFALCCFGWAVEFNKTKFILKIKHNIFAILFFNQELVHITDSHVTFHLLFSRH